jgi:predicted ATPase/class 3 adenylate cyclase
MPRGPRAPALPRGTVTFLFTDLEKSTHLLAHPAAAMRNALTTHHDLLRRAIEEHNGIVFETVGDAVYAVFEKPSDALASAIQCHRALLETDWGEVGPLRARMAVHTGEVELQRDGRHYVGEPLIRCARLLVLGHGGQTLLSNATAELARPSLPSGSRLITLGVHRLKDIAQTEHVYQLDHADLPTVFPPLRSVDARPSNLPIALTTFVGRSRELTELASLIRKRRFVTLTGAGGIGKTRLALELAAVVLPDFADGAFVADLAPLSDPQHIWPTVGAALGIQERPDDPVRSRSRRLPELIGEFLHGRHLILILDNCEQLVEACATVVKELLTFETHLVIVATSREALGVAGEQVWRVPSLAEAEDLFLDRARSVDFRFQLVEDESPTLAAICDRLERIPLALELAAARTKLLSLEEIATRLDDRFRLVAGSARGVAARQQTLQATVEWSHALLDDRERLVWHRLAVFAGGFTVEAAEAVAAGPPIDPDAVLDLLSALVDKSLVIADIATTGMRHRMLETLREYAHARLLDSGAVDEVQRQHASYYLALAERERAHMEKGAHQRRALDRLDAELDNLRAATRWAAAHDVNLAVKLGLASFRFLLARGHLEDARVWQDAVVPFLQQVEPSLRPRALRAVGVVSASRGDYISAEAFLKRALDEFRANGDTVGTSDALRALGQLAAAQGNAELSRSFFEQSLALDEAAGRSEGMALSLVGIGLVAWLRGEYARARETYELALRLRRAAGDIAGVAVVLADLALIELDAGDAGRAERLVKESIEMHREIGTKFGLAMALNVLASVLKERGDLDEAAARYVEAEAIERESELAPQLVATLLGRAEIALGRDDADLAAHLGQEAMRILAKSGSYRNLAWCYEVAARVAVVQRDWERAACLFGAREGTDARTGIVAPPHARPIVDAAIATTRAALGSESFAAIFSKGSVMSLRAATNLVLADRNGRAAI